MADDLADRISDGSIAVLDLVPGEQRFHELSRFVLRGGASRFAAAVLEDEPVRYVLPVGVPGRKLDYGTLLIQRTRCALVWRTDPARPYHAKIAELGPDTTVSQSPVAIRGEVWGRFDLQQGGTPAMTFLVPPVAATALPRMLHRVLVDEPRSRLAYIEAPPLPLEVTEGAAEPVPAPVEPDAPTEPLPATIPDAPTTSPDAPAPTSDATARWDARAAEADAPTEVIDLWSAEPQTTEPAAEVSYEDLYRTSERTSPTSPPPASADSASPAPAAPVPPVPVAPVASVPVAPVPGAQFAPPAPVAPTASESPTVSAVYRPVMAQPLSPTPVPPPATPVPAPVSAPRPVPRAEAAASGEVRPRPSDTVSGFLTGLIVTLVIGGLFILAKYLGWLG